MADYTKLVDYAAKDALLTGNPSKLVKGTEIGADFDAVSVAIATKYDSTDLGVTLQAYDADLTTWAGVTPGTGVATALAVNVGTAGSPVINGGALGTPSSGTLTNCTGLPPAGGGTGVANNAAMTVTGSGNYAYTRTLTGATNVTFPTTGTISTLAGTETLTNKRVTARVGSTTSSATPTINTDNVDIYKLTAQAADITSFTTNLSGTPQDGDVLIIEITGTAARAITWGASFEASTVALPTTTVTTAMLTVGFIWNTATTKWRCLLSA